MRKTEIETQLDNLDQILLIGLVRRTLNLPHVELGAWRYQVLHGGTGPATGGIYRVAGDVQDHSQNIPWSVILKVLIPSNADITHPTGSAYPQVLAEPFRRPRMGLSAGLWGPRQAAPLCPPTQIGTPG